MNNTYGRSLRKTEQLEVFFSWGWLWLSTILGLAVLIGLWGSSFWLLGFIWEYGWEVASYASVIGLVIAVLGYAFSEPLVVHSTQAQRLPDNDKYVRMTAALAKKARMRCPRVYIIPDSAANAFATGVHLPIPLIGGRGAIGLTEGIIRIMNDDELEGVIGHELTHLKSGDLILSTMASALIIALSVVLRIIVRSPRMLGNLRSSPSGFRTGSVSRGRGSFSSTRSSSSSRSGSGKKSSGGGSSAGGGCGVLLLAALKFFLSILIILGVIVALFVITQVLMPLVRAWINRQREYWADAGSAQILGSPDPLISALNKLSRSRTEVSGVGHFSGAFFNAPAVKRTDWLDGLFATHPPTSSRVAALSRRSDGQFNLL